MRTLLTTPDWQLIAPLAARMPFQLTLYPRAHHADMTTVSESAAKEAMALLQSAYRAYDRWFGHRAALVMALHQAPAHLAERDRYHFRFDLLPVERGPEKIKYLAGSELGMGAFVGDMLPEQAANSLRSLVKAEFDRFTV
jgi:UDPglucose--hexose-1-phosphate uridylyltransferase